MSYSRLRDTGPGGLRLLPRVCSPRLGQYVQELLAGVLPGGEQLEAFRDERCPFRVSRYRVNFAPSLLFALMDLYC
jgi:hypothetical protein